MRKATAADGSARGECDKFRAVDDRLKSLWSFLCGEPTPVDASSKHKSVGSMVLAALNMCKGSRYWQLQFVHVELDLEAVVDGGRKDNIFHYLGIIEEISRSLISLLGQIDGVQVAAVLRAGDGDVIEATKSLALSFARTLEKFTNTEIYSFYTKLGVGLYLQPGVASPTDDPMTTVSELLAEAGELFGGVPETDGAALMRSEAKGATQLAMYNANLGMIRALAELV
ncbi:MAG: hypothetical protein LBR91_01130 [Puniceicoccales bacterium]|jgi:hypothetical protein|nr:hypothetical protein [Puniceicoccales bacterium]